MTEKLSRDHELQRHNCLKMIEHLEIAKAYCELMWCCVNNTPENALLANVEPHNIESLIEDAKEQHGYIGGEWASIECSVIPEKEFI